MDAREERQRFLQERLLRIRIQMELLGILAAEAKAELDRLTGGNSDAQGGQPGV